MSIAYAQSDPPQVDGFIAVYDCDPINDATCNSPSIIAYTESGGDLSSNINFFDYLEPGSPEFWDLITASVALLALAWACKRVIKFLAR